jgi:hypothetical protein
MSEGSSRESTPEARMADAMMKKPRLADLEGSPVEVEEEEEEENGPLFLPLAAALESGEASAHLL